eukprot:superscaffoldBa00004070_g18211
MAHCSESILQANYRQHKQQPSASARTEQEATVSEDNIIFVNDLLPPRVGAISTYSAPAAQSATHVKASRPRVFGFGVLDAGLMVQQATHFKSVGPSRKCTQEVTIYPTRILSPRGVVSVNIQSKACRGKPNEINSLEEVQKAWVRPSLRGVIDGRVAVVTRRKQERAVSLFAAWRLSLRCAIVTPDVLLVMNRDSESVYWVRVSIRAVCRGDLSISLESPGGTVSMLLDTRPHDASTAGLKNWTLMTVHSWGEHPRGLWTLQVTDNKGSVRSCSRPNEEEAAGAVLSVTLILYGTKHPHRTKHKGPLQSIVSMGSRHPIPHIEPRDRYPPLDLIEWVYRMERDRKVRAADITTSARHKLHQADGQRSSAGSRPAAAKELHKSNIVSDNVDEQMWSLPWKRLQYFVGDVRNVQQLDSSDPGEPPNREAGQQ